MKAFLNQRATRADVECLALARAGFYVREIASKTGLTISQVHYRLKMAGIKTTSYRRMESDLAKRIVSCIANHSAQYFDTIASEVRRYLKDA